ncbi:Uncharacterized protein APZ42_024471 [Daphnia magna]|uniref:Uncharacterized protein n=1 Tax=Daphnia magna TaxID=35525 RepID=A0A164U126_9CRUS|nr:Uncharacterized protein APZ42_024471 [Daphnia magna]
MRKRPTCFITRPSSNISRMFLQYFVFNSFSSDMRVRARRGFAELVKRPQKHLVIALPPHCPFIFMVYDGTVAQKST